jgi:hypothetical protein
MAITPTEAIALYLECQRIKTEQEARARAEVLTLFSHVVHDMVETHGLDPRQPMHIDCRWVPIADDIRQLGWVMEKGPAIDGSCWYIHAPAPTKVCVRGACVFVVSGNHKPRPVWPVMSGEGTTRTVCPLGIISEECTQCQTIQRVARCTRSINRVRSGSAWWDSAGAY